MKNKLRVKIIWWEDLQHHKNISMNFCGVMYHLMLNISPDKTITDEDIYEILTQILFFQTENEKQFQTEEEFNPHNIISEEEFYGMYYANIMDNTLNYITIN